MVKVFFEDEQALVMLKRILREEYWVEVKDRSQADIILLSKMGDEYYDKPYTYLITCHGIFEPAEMSIVRGFTYGGRFYEHSAAMRTGVCEVGKPSAIYWK